MSIVTTQTRKKNKQILYSNQQKLSKRVKSGSKRFTTDKLDKNLIISYDSSKPDKCLFTISTTAKDFISEFEISGESAYSISCISVQNKI